MSIMEQQMQDQIEGALHNQEQCRGLLRQRQAHGERLCREWARGG